MTIRQNQAARLDGRIVDRTMTRSRRGRGARYIRAIEPPPVVIPRTLRLDFDNPVPGTLHDADGRGIGLTRRLPGTGGDLPGSDPNLRLRPDRGALELTTTRSDLNTQERMPTGEYLGVRLGDLGFTGAEDFEIRVTIPNIPGLNVVGQFGLYAGTSSDRNIRGGLISWPRPDTYRLFLVNNSGGIDSDIYEVGLTTTGDDLRLTLSRLGGKYSLVVDNLKRNSSSTLAIAHPKFLDGESELYLGIFGANTQSDLRKTLTIREFSVTVWTAQSGFAHNGAVARQVESPLKSNRVTSRRVRGRAPGHRVRSDALFETLYYDTHPHPRVLSGPGPRNDSTRRRRAAPSDRRRIRAGTLSVLFLGDKGHHVPADRAAQLTPVFAGRGIKVTYTEKSMTSTPRTWPATTP